MSNYHLELAESIDDLYQRGARQFVAAVQAAVAERGQAAVALSGGSTPKGLYARVAQDHRNEVDWSKTHIFWGDERSVPPDHADSNYRMAHEAMIAHLPIPQDNVHRMHADATDRDAAAREYEALVRRIVGRDATPRFDLIHLGMGDDGHTASLFPFTAALDETARLVVPNHVEKLDTWRMTFTYPLLNAAREVVFLVGGAGKAGRLRQVLEGPPNRKELPSQGVQPSPGRLTWLVEKVAAAQLQPSVR